MEAVGMALLQNPEGFANAAKLFVEAQGAAIENVQRAIGVLTNARQFISSSTTTDHAIIVNLSDKECTWYTYNDISPVELITQFQSHMGAFCAISVHCLGYGAMACFKDNEEPKYLLERNKVYTFDGKNTSMFMSK